MADNLDPLQETARFCLDRGLVDLVRYKSAEMLSRASGLSVYNILVDNGSIEDGAVKELVSSYLDLPKASIDDVRRKAQTYSNVIPPNFSRENRIIPFEDSENRVSVALAEPSALRSLSSVRLIVGKDIAAYVISPAEMGLLLGDLEDTPSRNASGSIKVLAEASTPAAVQLMKESQQLKRNESSHAAGLGSGKAGTKNTQDIQADLDSGQGKQVISFVNDLIMAAIKQGASDIHIENYKDRAVTRYRIDGVLEERKSVASFLFGNYPAVSTRIKIMAELDISERRLPQDGAITMTLQDGRDVDLRVSVLPTVFGERIVMRILDRGGISFDLDKLGFPEKEYKDVIASLEASQGMILVTGPTGSGKSTTLYGAIRRLNKPGVNILTAEDPVEFTMDGVGQVQIRDDIGLTFASALRSFLRQDPEVILVGEIRDKDTADISIKAALTGHLVLSTLHANDAISTIVRLINMGIPGYLIGAALTLVVAQRLARRICSHCKEPQPGDHKAILMNLGFTDEQAASVNPFHGAGCEHCNQTGYKGRQGVYEVLRINEEMRAAIIAEDRRDLRSIAERTGFRTMQMIGRDMICEGVLTIEEYQNNLIFN